MIRWILRDRLNFPYKIAVKILKIFIQTKNKFDENSMWTSFKYKHKQIQANNFYKSYKLLIKVCDRVWIEKLTKICRLLYARLEIISDVVSERHVAEKFRYHIGFFRYHIRCGIGKNRCGIGISDVVSEFFRYVPFPIPHRKLFLTVCVEFNHMKNRTTDQWIAPLTIETNSLHKKGCTNCDHFLFKLIFPLLFKL